MAYLEYARRHSLPVILRKYADPPEQYYWRLVGDTDEFWSDVEVIYGAAMDGNRKAIRIMLWFEYHSDGHVSEWLPDARPIIEAHPEIAREIFLEEKALRKKGAHWVFSPEELAALEESQQEE